MKITTNPDGSISFEADFVHFLQAFSGILNWRQKSKAKKFLEIHQFMAENRPQLSKLARNYYVHKNCTLIKDHIPLLVESAGFDGQLHNIQEIDLIFTDVKSKTEENKNLLPDPKKTYIENLIEQKFQGNEEKSPFRNNFCYRLTEINHPTSLQFEKCTYFDYLNTCEYQFYAFAYQLITNTKKDGTVQYPKIKRTIDYSNYTNRYLVAGINTLLVFWDEKQSLMYLHQRSKKNVAEAINVKHVVPAGSFQPIHFDNGNHKSDFSLYTNIMREFGEELLGDEELIHPAGVLENVLERTSLTKINQFIQKDRGIVYYGGVAFDCLTLKPEILSIMVLRRSDFESEIGPINFKENPEGLPFAIEFNVDNLNRYIKDEEMLPAGAGCLWLALQHYDKINAFMDSK